MASNLEMCGRMSQIKPLFENDAGHRCIFIPFKLITSIY